MSFTKSNKPLTALLMAIFLTVSVQNLSWASKAGGSDGGGGFGDHIPNYVLQKAIEQIVNAIEPIGERFFAPLGAGAKNTILTAVRNIEKQPRTPGYRNQRELIFDYDLATKKIIAKELFFKSYAALPVLHMKAEQQQRIISHTVLLILHEAGHLLGFGLTEATDYEARAFAEQLLWQLSLQSRSWVNGLRDARLIRQGSVNENIKRLYNSGYSRPIFEYQTIDGHNLFGELDARPEFQELYSKSIMCRAHFYIDYPDHTKLNREELFYEYDQSSKQINLSDNILTLGFNFTKVSENKKQESIQILRQLDESCPRLPSIKGGENITVSGAEEREMKRRREELIDCFSKSELSNQLVYFIRSGLLFPKEFGLISDEINNINSFKESAELFSAIQELSDGALYDTKLEDGEDEERSSRKAFDRVDKYFIEGIHSTTNIKGNLIVEQRVTFGPSEANSDKEKEEERIAFTNKLINWGFLQVSKNAEDFEKSINSIFGFIPKESDNEKYYNFSPSDIKQLREIVEIDKVTMVGKAKQIFEFIHPETKRIVPVELELPDMTCTDLTQFDRIRMQRLEKMFSEKGF